MKFLKNPLLQESQQGKHREWIEEKKKRYSRRKYPSAEEILQLEKDPRRTEQAYKPSF